MKPSEMKKDKNLTLRVNSEVRKKLKEKNISPQKIFDEALDKKIKLISKLK